MKIKKAINRNLSTRLLVLLMLSTLMMSGKLVSEEENGFVKTNLTSEAPKALEPFMEIITDQIRISKLKYASFVTGIDSVSVYFGSMMQFGKPGHWVTIAINDTIFNFSPVRLLETDTLKFPSNNIDLNFDNGMKRLSLRVMHNPDTDEVYYAWLQNGKTRNLAQIVNLDTPIQINNVFPELEVELLNEEKLNIRDLQGKYVVINWWHSGCGPCIVAIPGMNRLVDKYKNRQNIEFLAIAFDSRERVKSVLVNREFKFTHSLANKETTRIFGETFPKYLILNPEGVVTYFTSGGSANSYEGIDMALTRQIGD